MIRFNKRKFFHFGKSYDKSISFEIAGFNCSPSISLTVDGPDQAVVFGISFGLAFYFRMEGIIPKSWFPSYLAEPYGYLPEEKEIRISFFDWCLNWSFWMRPHEWNSTDSKLRRGSFDFQRFLKGKHTCEWIPIRTNYRMVNMIEDSYPIRVIENRRVDKWERWFTKESISYDVTVGDFNESGEFIQKYIPVEGKGENSWDCGESGTGGCTFPYKKHWNHRIDPIEEAVLYFETDVKRDRIRYGGVNWKPRAYRDEIDRLLA